MDIPKTLYPRPGYTFNRGILLTCLHKRAKKQVELLPTIEIISFKEKRKK